MILIKSMHVEGTVGRTNFVKYEANRDKVLVWNCIYVTLTISDNGIYKFCMCGYRLRGNKYLMKHLFENQKWHIYFKSYLKDL